MKIASLFIVFLFLQASPPTPRETPENSGQESNNSQAQTAPDQKPTPEPVVIDSRAAEKSQESGKKDASQNEDRPVRVFPVDVNKNWPDYLYIFANLLIAFATLVIAGIAWKQANAAVLSAQSVISAERPWLLIPLGDEFSEVYEPVLVAPLPGEIRKSYCTFKLENFGRSPAKVIEQKVGLFTGIDVESVPDADAYNSDGAFPEDYTFPQNSTLPLQATFAPNGYIALHEIEEIMVYKRFLWLCGYCKYRDTFDRKDAPIYESRFCYRWVYNAVSSTDIKIRKSFWIMAGPREYNKAT